MGSDPKFNRIAPPECNFIKTELCSNRIGVDPIDHILYAKPNGHIRKYIHDACQNLISGDKSPCCKKNSCCSWFEYIISQIN